MSEKIVIDYAVLKYDNGNVSVEGWVRVYHIGKESVEEEMVFERKFANDYLGALISISKIQNYNQGRNFHVYMDNFPEISPGQTTLTDF